MKMCVHSLNIVYETTPFRGQRPRKRMFWFAFGIGGFRQESGTQLRQNSYKGVLHSPG